MKMRLIFFVFVLLGGFTLSAQEGNVQTVNYYQELEMDIYTPPESNGPSAVILFVHGGGFAGGSRNTEEIRNLANEVNRAGITFVSISYRLLMKGRGFGCDIPAAEKLSVFANAGLDASRATNYLIDRSDKLNINKDLIILAGSSAGAEAVLHLAYWPDASTFDGKPVLPSDFRYAGVISFAGALVDDQLITESNSIPTMLVHGTCDNLVPYDFAPHHYCEKGSPGYLMLHGAGSLASRLEYLNKPYFLYTACGGNHDWAGIPIREMVPQIIDFVQYDVISGNFRQVHEWNSESGSCNYEEPGECR